MIVVDGKDVLCFASDRLVTVFFGPIPYEFRPASSCLDCEACCGHGEEAGDRVLEPKTGFRAQVNQFFVSHHS